MSLVYIGIGSNVDREKNIRSCIKCLHEKYSVISLSPLYETSSMGFDGPNFYNLVCCFETSQDVVDLKNELSVIEKNHGRSMNETKFSSRTLDIDILYYDDLIYEDDNLKLPRKEIIQYLQKNFKGNESFIKVVKSSAFCSENNEIISDNYKITKDQKIGIIPPIGGG